MASSSTAVAKRSAGAALMPPPAPPIKKIKRPATVLDEDDYTDALSDIIARDYFPGLQESRAQQEYLNALDSKDAAWIAEAAQNLKNAAEQSQHARHSPSNAATATATATAANATTATPIKAEPSTPLSEVPVHSPSQQQEQQPRLNTTKLSLSDFQSRYTSEDNASFNDVLDKQNAKRRNKHAYLWTADQRIPAKHLLLHRARQQQLIERDARDKAAAKSDGRELIPLTTGATESRPAQPDSWKCQSPANSLMFNPASVDEDGLTTQQEVRERNSKAGPKTVVLENTRFPPLQLQYPDDDQRAPPSSPSLNTDIINSRRDPVAASSSGMSAYPGGETPRVNGYSFVDEDEPNPTPAAPKGAPSYRDLLAGQAGDATPNPFKLSSARRREQLHHKLVDEAKRKKRQHEMQSRRPIAGGLDTTAATPTLTPLRGNMTPAARKLLQNLSKTKTPSTPVLPGPNKQSNDNDHDNDNANMWTPPVRTPRRTTIKGMK